MTRRAALRAPSIEPDPLWRTAIAHSIAHLARSGRAPTEVQSVAFDALSTSTHDALFVAPTGTGKTLATLLPLCCHAMLTERPAPAGIRILYLAPVRALVSRQTDVLTTLCATLASEFPGGSTLRVAARSGDTSSSARASQKRTPPDLLVVTPESLAVLLATGARDSLLAVETIVLDEVHQLADGKRGALLATTLETLSLWLARNGRPRPRRLGMSATAHPVKALAQWVGGSRRAADPYVVEGDRRTTVELLAPSLDTPYPAAGWTGRMMLPAIARAVATAGGISLVFVPTRLRAEQWTQALRDVLPPRFEVACFHGSMAAEEREAVLTRLMAGELTAMVATSSLEAGVDVPDVEQVLVLSTPQSITQLRQAAGRSRHRPGEHGLARIAPTNAPDLVAALATIHCAADGELEPVKLRRDDLDVAVQAVMALCSIGPAPFGDILSTLHSSTPFAHLEESTLHELLDHLMADGGVFEAYADSHRIVHTPVGYVFADARAHRAYTRAVGTIVDEPAVAVKFHGRTIGRVDGRFAALLEPGDRFAFAGSNWKVVLRTAVHLDVTRETRDAKLAARWTGTRMSASELITAASERLYGELDGLVPVDAASDRDVRDRTVARVAKSLRIADPNALALVRLVVAQRRTSTVPSPARFVVELMPDRGRLHILAHTFAGTMANEVIGRAAASRWRRASARGAEVVSSDATVAVTLPHEKGTPLPDEHALRLMFSPHDLANDLADTLEGSSLARYHFRDVARIAQLVVGTSRPGAATPALIYDVLRRHDAKHVLLRALEHTLWSSLDGARAERVLTAMATRTWCIATGRNPSAIAIPLVVQGMKNRERIAPPDLEGALAEAAHSLFERAGGEMP